jgi:hypothetical protein
VALDPVVLVTELDVLPLVAGPDEHPAATTAIATADMAATDLRSFALGGVIARVTFPLLSSAALGGGRPIAPWSAASAP